MSNSTRPSCPTCKKRMTFAPTSFEGQRSWQCLDCDRPDPLTSERTLGWLKGELAKKEPSDLGGPEQQ